MLRSRLLPVVAVTSLAISPLRGQDAAPKTAEEGTLRLHFVRAGVPVPEYTLEVRGGSGTYRAQSSAPPSSNRYAVAAASGPVETVQQFSLLPQHSARLLQLLGATRGLTGCASNAKGIADLGRKTLTWTPPAAMPVSCTFNYSENKPVVELATMLAGIAQSLDEGRKLEHLHRYDRLGLDAETMYLASSVKEGRAQAVETIAPTLQSLVDDPEVMERARARAAKLLAESGSTP